VGATSADTQREIEEIRKDVTSATQELFSRANRFAGREPAGGRRSTQTRPGAARAWGRSIQLKDHPAALAGLAVTVAGVGGVAGAKAFADYRRRQLPEERLRRTVRTAAEELGVRWGRAREAIPLEVHLGREADQKGRRQPKNERSDPGMIKKALWGALVAVMVAAGGLMARRLSVAVWRAAMNEDPPTKSV
jgi:hypothetical protein